MKKGLEIERKFLVEMPDLKKLNVLKITDIKQTYLSDGKNGSQRRVRKITCGNNVSMTYTEKNFISPMVREEAEKLINCAEYNSLLEEAKDTAPVEKKRAVFLYENQRFELDIYPFSEKYAILELELQNPAQEIYFPENINVLREVTGNKLYSNITLANAKTFPEK